MFALVFFALSADFFSNVVEASTHISVSLREKRFFQLLFPGVASFNFMTSDSFRKRLPVKAFFPFVKHVARYFPPLCAL